VDDAEDAYAEEWSQLAEQARLNGSEYLIEVMADGRMDRAEYNESAELLVACVNDEFPELPTPPYSFERDGNGLVSQHIFAGPEELVYSDRPDEVIERCGADYGSSAMFLFEQEERNPARVDGWATAIQCLIDSGLVSEDYTRENLMADMYYDGNANQDQGGPPRDLATDLDAWSAESHECIAEMS